MRELSLFAVVAAVFVLGWIFIKKWACFLENNYKIQDMEILSERNTLRIGFSNPLVSESITNILEKYSEIHTDLSVRIFYGTEKELINQLVISKLDVVFLSENDNILLDGRYNIKKVLLSDTPVIMKYSGFPIEPAAAGSIVQNVLWLKEAGASFVNFFVECIEGEISVSVL